ncbi:MAG: hypothetical protein IIV97_02590, partial [Oscillospiraceae bacterium]|nr:hypothetical protein [Oscillospiraceae bacterium]
DTGMLLFPGEDTPFPVKEKNGVRLCVCKGRCSRDDRPLSCMLFPFFPYMTPEGRIEVKADYRGYNICPMIEHREKIRFNKAFLRRVARVGRLLSKDEECRKFLRETSRELEMLERFYE